MYLRFLTFEEAKKSLIKLVDKILQEELETHFYIGKAWIEKKKKKNFDLKDDNTWIKGGINDAYYSDSETKMKQKADFTTQKMFILAAVDKTCVPEFVLNCHLTCI